MTDTEIIASIQNGEVDETIKYLYREFPKIKNLICSSGGSKSEARETFHDALLLLIEKISNPDFELSSKISTYLYGINRLLWKNKLRKKQSTRELEWSDTLIISNEDLGMDPEREQKIRMLEQVLEEITKRCREVFTRFYFREESMKSIAAAMGFSSENSAKTQKYKCIERAISLASNQNLKNL